MRFGELEFGLKKSNAMDARLHPTVEFATQIQQNQLRNSGKRLFTGEEESLGPIFNCAWKSS